MTPREVAISAPLLRHLLSERQAALMAGCATTVYSLLTTYYLLLTTHHILLTTCYYLLLLTTARRRALLARGGDGGAARRATKVIDRHLHLEDTERARAARRAERSVLSDQIRQKYQISDTASCHIRDTASRSQIAPKDAQADRQTEKRATRDTSAERKHLGLDA